MQDDGCVAVYATWAGRTRWAVGVGVGVQEGSAVFALRIIAGVARRGGQGSEEEQANRGLRCAGSWHQHDMEGSEQRPV